MSKWSMSLLRVQRTAQMPLVQFTEKLVDVTLIMRTSSNSDQWRCFRFRFRRFDRVVNTPAVQPTAPLPGANPENLEGCRDDTGAVQGDEPALQKRASLGCDAQAGIQLIVVVPVLVRCHACSGQFLSVIHDGVPTLQALEGRRAAASHS